MFAATVPKFEEPASTEFTLYFAPSVSAVPCTFVQPLGAPYPFSSTANP